MEMERPTEEGRETFRALAPEAPGVTVRAMFGNLAAFVNGNMFMALYGDRVAFKMDATDLARARARDDAEPFGPGGRTMREYVAFPLAAPDLEPWIEGSLAYVGTLPPK